MGSSDQANAGIFRRVFRWFKALWESIVSKMIEAGRDLRSLGAEDPRRVVHSFKVGVAIALVSVVYYFDPIYEGFGISAMWAVMTVVVVFEFSVGTTIGRGMNRGIATFLGGALGVGAHRLASAIGIEKIEPIILALSVFSFAAIVTFLRFVPKLKARYDYGLMISNLTFCLICVSAYRDDEVIDIAITRLSTVFIGGFVTVLVCILVLPVWAGEDLHNLVADNVEKLASFLQGFGDEYLKALGDENAKENKSLLEEHTSLLTSKTVEDTLVNAAKWEPRHGRFRFRHPWDQYQKIGGLTRQLAYRLDSLKSHLNSETTTNPEIRARFQKSCKKMSSESSHALKKMASAIRTMTSASPSAKSHILNAKVAENDLKLLLKTNPWQHNDLLQVIPVATVASLLAEIVSCTAQITESVHELACLANFKAQDDASKSEELQRGTERVMGTPGMETSHSLHITA